MSLTAGSLRLIEFDELLEPDAGELDPLPPPPPLNPPRDPDDCPISSSTSSPGSSNGGIGHSLSGGGVVGTLHLTPIDLPPPP